MEAGLSLLWSKTPRSGSLGSGTDPRMDAETPTNWPDSLSDLPTWLAIPLSEYLAELNPRVRLHWMLDTVEVAIRWAVAVALADVRQANDGGLPKMLQRSIQDHIERPTVGRWVGMLRALSKSEPGAPLSPGVFALHDDLVELLDARLLGAGRPGWNQGGNSRQRHDRAVHSTSPEGDLPGPVARYTISDQL